MKTRVIMLILLVMILVPIGSMAERIEVSPSQDAYVYNGSPSTNYGASTNLLVLHQASIPEDMIARAYLKFDLEGVIPPDATIDLAYLYIYDSTVGYTHDVTLYKVTSAWLEDSITWNEQPTFSGGFGTIEGYSAAGWFYAEVTSLVAEWHAGTTSNHGILIKEPFWNMGGDTRVFHSKENPNRKPKLVVIYNCESTEITPEMDSFVSFDTPNTNYGSSTHLEVANAGCWSYLQFDTTGVPANASIDFVRLRMYHYDGSSDLFGFPVYACSVTGSWKEDSITWNNKPGHATPWPDMVKGWVGYSSYNGWLDLDITNFFKGWLGGSVNNGVVIKYPLDLGTGSTDPVGAFRSSEYADEAYRPRLEVFYTAPPTNNFTVWQDLTGVDRGDAVWGDVDGDGDLDLVTCGDNGAGIITLSYKNQGGTLSPYSSGLPGVKNQGSDCMDWGDYDNDGDLDLAIAGAAGGAGFIARIYENDGTGNFTWDTGQVLTGVNNASLAWGDVDNDGDLDLYLQGYDGVDALAFLYENDPLGTLTERDSLTGLHKGSADWADWDNDGDLDLLVTGITTDAVRKTIFYSNAGDSLDYSLGSNGNMGIPDVCFSDAAWGDYDRDGDLDLAITGQDAGLTEYTNIYENVPQLDTLKGVWSRSTGLLRGSCAWGDFDNDGWLDVGFSGWSNVGGDTTEIYYYAGLNSFVLFTTLDGAQGGSVSWADVDDDADLDFFLTGLGTSRFARLYRNNGGVTNTAPSAPNTFTAIQDFDIPFNPGRLVLQWSGASDNETSQLGLYYCVRVGTEMGADDVLSGTYGTPLLGNVGQATELEISIPYPSRPYYWSVKVIDTGLMASEWSQGQCSWDPDSVWSKIYHPNEDAYVFNKNPETTYGATADSLDLRVGDVETSGHIARTYFLFSFSEAFLDTAIIESVELHVYCSDAIIPPAFTGYYVGVWVENVDSWNEATITWYKAPTAFHPSPSDVVKLNPGWCVWDVTNNFEAGTLDNTLTLVLRNYDPPEGFYGLGCQADFYSDEWPTESLRPYLKIMYSTLTGVEDGDSPTAHKFSLAQNFPNPFNPHTRLSYTIPERPPASHVFLRIYDVAGRLVKTLIDAPQPAGTYIVTWDGTNQEGIHVASGVYFYHLRWNGKSKAKKMVLLR